MNQFKVFITFLLLLTGIGSYSQTTLFDQQMQVGFQEKQGQYVDLNVKLVDEAGDTVLLKDVLDKPAILNLVYFRCKDYDVLTISFDPSETIDLGIDKKASYINTMQKKEEAANWRFFVADSADVARLTKSVGFTYQKVNDQYVHPTGLIALAADGKIVRYLRGIDFLPFDIKITMVEAAKGKIGPSINRLLAVCYGYDSEGNKFVFNVTRVSAIVILFILVVTFLILALSRLKLTKKVNK